MKTATHQNRLSWNFTCLEGKLMGNSKQILNVCLIGMSMLLCSQAIATICDPCPPCYTRTSGWPTCGCSYDCTGCQSCEGGGCVENDCPTCWAWKDYYPGYLQACPSCSDDLGGCYGSQTLIILGHSLYTGELAGEGEVGICGVKTKQMIVGQHVFCIEKDTNISAIIAIISALGDISGYANCTLCLATRKPKSCFDCLFSLITDGLVEDVFPCLFIGECDHCPLSDPDCAPEVEYTVVDWGNVPACDVCSGSFSGS